MDSDTNSTPLNEIAGEKRKRSKAKSPSINRDTKVKWTNKEKRILLDAVKNFGHKDLDKLAECLTTKTKLQIGAYLRSRETYGTRIIKQKRKAGEMEYENWFQTIYLVMMKHEDFSQLISDALGVISQNEIDLRSYDGQKSKRNNLFELYKYIQSLHSQELVSPLSMGNQKIISYLFDMLMRIVDGVLPNLQEEMHVLNELIQNSVIKAKEKTAEVDDEKGLNELKFSLNPIEIPDNILEEINNKLQNEPLYTQEIEAFLHMFV